MKKYILFSCEQAKSNHLTQTNSLKSNKIMKKLIILLVILMSTFFSAFSQSADGYTLLANKIYIDYCDGQGYSKVSDCNKVLDINFAEQEMHINGVESYVWNNKSTIYQNKVQITTMNCIDREDIRCDIDIYIYYSSVFIKISYSNIIIKYRINKVIPY